jgi:hypothetical protein
MSVKKRSAEETTEKTEEKNIKTTIPEDQVRLKPILGIRPGVYLACLYSLVLVIILFFVLIFPGLKNPGSALVFTSEPAGAAVRVDGVYQGTTPFTAVIPQGNRTVEMVLPGFTPSAAEVPVPARIFASLIFPRTIPVGFDLTAESPLAPLIAAAADFAEWSFAGEPTTAYQIPRSLSEGAYRIGSAPGVSAEALGDLLQGAARFAVTRSSLRDLIRAGFLTGNGGLAPSPVSLAASGRDILDFLADNPGSAAWLADLLPPKSASRITGSAWYAETIETAAGLTGESPGGVTFRSGGFGRTLDLPASPSLTFWEVTGGTLIEGAVFPHPIIIETFWIADTELSRNSWNSFLNEQPQWKTEEGEYSFPQADSAAIGGITWYAAEAYCRWLSAALPPALAGWEVRLPTEAEWEYAAKIAAAEAVGPVNLIGGRWEWCADPYAPLHFFPASAETIARISSPERSLRGGAWINPPGSVGAETRGSLSPDTASPFVSVRPIIAQKGTP